MNGAEVILADEPTGALDSRSGEEVLALLTTLHAQGRTIILITHDAAVAAHAQRIIQIKDGRIVEDSGTVAAHVAQNPERQAPAQHPHWLADRHHLPDLPNIAMLTRLLETLAAGATS